jgi:hypothetical protein
MLWEKVQNRFSEGVAPAFRAWMERCATGDPYGIATDNRPSRVAQETANQVTLEKQIQPPGNNPDYAAVNQFDLNGHNPLHLEVKR